MRYAFYAALILLVQPLVGCGSGDAPSADQVENGGGETEATSAEDYDHLIVAFGDSLYAGYGLEQNDGFAPELQRALAERGQSARVVNAGVSGDTTAAGLQRLDFTLDGLDATPDLVIVGLGGNDMLRGISPDQTRANLTEIVEALEQRGIPVMLTGMIAAPNLGEDYAAQFNPIYGDLAQQYDLPLYPFFLDGVIQRPDLMLPDGIHPTAEGIDMVVERLEQMVATEISDS